jgi:hypothetical protein
MPSLWVATMRKRIFVVICSFALSSCDRVIEQGEFHGMTIGQTPSEVLEVLGQQGVSHVLPDVDALITVKIDNIDELERLMHESSIGVTDNKGLDIEIEFDGNTLANLKVSEGANGNSLGLVTGQSKTNALSIIEKAIKVNPSLVVANFTPNARWIKLSSITSDDIEYLGKYGTWSYHEPDSHSHAVLRFQNGRLHRIEYHWRLFEEI